MCFPIEAPRIDSRETLEKTISKSKLLTVLAILGSIISVVSVILGVIGLEHYPNVAKASIISGSCLALFTLCSFRAISICNQAIAIYKLGNQIRYSPKKVPFSRPELKWG